MKTCQALMIGLIATIHPLQTYAASLAFQNLVSNDNPILYYQLNESSGDAVNYGSLGTSFNATYNGTPLRSASTLSGDTGVAFDGSDDFLESNATTPSSLGGNPSFTVEAIVFMPAAGTAAAYGPMLHWGESVGSQANKTGKSVYFSYSNNFEDRYYAGFYNGGLRTQDSIEQGVWHHVVWVREGGTMDVSGSTLYVDGVAVPLEIDTGLCCNGFTPDVTANTAFRINRAQDFTRFFTGTLDEVALYDYELDAATVLKHYQSFVNPFPDTDNDGVADIGDNCVLVPNGPDLPDTGGLIQYDSNGDGFGNACDPDLNNDDVVDFADLPDFQQSFFTQDGDPNWDPNADLNGDGVIDFADLPTIQTLFFGPPGPSGLSP